MLLAGEALTSGRDGDTRRDIEAAYRDETRRLIARRFPVAAAIFLALMAVAYLIEWSYFPQRWVPLSLTYAGFAAIALACTAALRHSPRLAVPVTLAGSAALAGTLTAYLALVHRSAELCLLAMIGFLTGEVVQFPWGVGGQAIASASAIAAYVGALASGAGDALPIPYGLFALASHALMTVIGARLPDVYRFTAFCEAADSARHAADSARANAAKSEFLATVSHELRTPLNIIVGYTDLLIEGAFDAPDERLEALGRIHPQSRQLLDLIQSMLDLNRMEGGGIPLVIEEFTVDTALESLRSGLPSNWCKPGVALRWETGEEPLRMRSDRGKLEMILRNLIHNACKYTEAGAVTISARADHGRGRVAFAVADTGQGIAAEDVASIFDMFRQGSSGPPRGGGVGLGLYIVRQLTNALGGEIAVDSRVGSGSRFILSLPLQVRDR